MILDLWLNSDDRSKITPVGGAPYKYWPGPAMPSSFGRCIPGAGMI